MPAFRHAQDERASELPFVVSLSDHERQHTHYLPAGSVIE